MIYVKFTGGIPNGEIIGYREYKAYTNEEFSPSDVDYESENLWRENAESLAPLPWVYETEEEFEEENTYYWDNIWADWEIITKEEYEDATGEIGK